MRIPFRRPKPKRVPLDEHLDRVYRETLADVLPLLRRVERAARRKAA